MRSWKARQETELGRFPCSRELARGRERKRQRKTRGPKSLVEQGCFNDLSVSIYRLLYKECLLTMIKIRKPNVQHPLSREQGVNNGHKVRRQSISQERGSWLSSFVIRRMFTEGNPCMCFILWLQFLLPGTDKELGIYERQKQHTGILLLNVLWYTRQHSSVPTMKSWKFRF